MAEKEKAPRPEGYVTGRPTKYRPEFCQMLVNHMADGGSFEGFAGKIRVSWEALYDWIEKHPEFLQAKKEGFTASKEFWEQTMADQARGKINGSSTALIFALKNRFPKDYRDRTEVKHQAYIGDIEDDPERLDQSQLEEIAKITRAKKK